MKIIRIILCFILSFSVVFTAIYADKIYEDKITSTSSGYKGILTLWHVDSFEGGRGSRKQFLLDMACAFEKQYDGVLVMVISLTPTGVEENLEKGIVPDMISYGNGVVVKGAIGLNGSFGGASVGDKCYAYPWCKGGYVLIGNEEIPDHIETLTVSQAEYTLPLVALLEEGISVDNIEVLSPMDAYVKFVEGKTKYLLGTQRDINRLYVREKEVCVKPLETFCDLYQYVSVTSSDNLKAEYSKYFVEYLMSDAVQNKLNKIGMLSCTTNSEHDILHLNEMQKVLQKKTISVFTFSQIIKDLQALSLKAVKGDTDAINKIKNLLLET